mmetsp:Transcript_1834/g.5229  ORF Transcript_1834/g.5229 Transcript_1834/m.5229 type:complete len:231 (+) Transcript_1834:183-875(+)
MPLPSLSAGWESRRRPPTRPLLAIGIARPRGGGRLPRLSRGASRRTGGQRRRSGRGKRCKGRCSAFYPTRVRLPQAAEWRRRPGCRQSMKRTAMGRTTQPRGEGESLSGRSRPLAAPPLQIRERLQRQWSGRRQPRQQSGASGRRRRLRDSSSRPSEARFPLTWRTQTRRSVRPSRSAQSIRSKRRHQSHPGLWACCHRHLSGRSRSHRSAVLSTRLTAPTITHPRYDSQ